MPFRAYRLVCTIVGKIIAGGNAVTICAVDLTKVSDKVNHRSLLMKLMKRRIPLELLELFENRFSESYTCVKWVKVGHTYSR